MASSNLHKLLSTLLLFLSIATNSPVTTTAQECPYPCYPPPISGGGGSQTTTPPAVTQPPPATPQTGSVPAPPTFNSPPTGVISNYPSPSNDYDNGENPSPDHVVPWFPYYDQRPLHPSESIAPPLTAAGILFMMNLLLLHLVL